METDPQETPLQKKPLKGRKVLWIEDDILLSEIIAKKLKGSGTTLLHAIDATSAFKILEKETPDIIFLDILLPGISGYEILEKLKKEEKTKNIPVIILSNFGQKSEVEKGLALGAEKFLIKATITLDEIFTDAEKILEAKTK